MPVSPSQCKEHFNERDENEFQRLVEIFDRSLMAGYYGQGSYSINTTENPSARVQTKIVEAYKKAGWANVSFERINDQRDGNYTNVKFHDRHSSNFNSGYLTR